MLSDQERQTLSTEAAYDPVTVVALLLSRVLKVPLPDMMEMARQADSDYLESLRRSRENKHPSFCEDYEAVSRI